VQFAAAQGLLRAPGTAAHGKQARIVEILKRAAAADTTDPGAKTVGRALVADPVDTRGEKTARYLRQLGYSVERLPTGRALLRRAAAAADYDLIVLDRHLAAPTVADTLAQLRTDTTAGRRPVMLVASADNPAPVPVEQLLARLAALAVTLPDDADRGQPVTVEPPFTFDPRRPVTDEATERAAIAARRDRALLILFDRRLARLQAFVRAADLPTSAPLQARLADRLSQLVLAAFANKYGVSPRSSPRTFDRLQYYTNRLATQPAVVDALNQLPTAGLARLAESLEGTLADRREFEALLPRLMATTGRSEPTAEELRVQEGLGRLARQYPAVTVIPEPFTVGEVKPDGVSYGFSQDVAAATQAPAAKPVPPEAKKATARQAVRWLRALAVGEVPGFDVRPAEPALRQALRDDELAPDAVDAVGRIPSAEAQQDLLNLALSMGRPLPLRTQAAAATARHLLAYGRFVAPAQAADVAKQAAAETDPALRANLLVIEQLATAKPGDLGKLMTAYPAPLPKPPAPPPPAEGAEKRPEDKKPEEKKE
jgi:CheY-like chemotaxis protein